MNVLRWPSAAVTFADAHPTAVAVSAVVVLAAGFAGWRAVRRLSAGTRKVMRDRQAEDVLTLVAAAVATTVAMTGMWRFFGVVLGFSGLLRALLFAFIEVAVITSAFRARRTMRQFGNAGIDGAAVWGLTGLSAVLSSLDARSAAEAVFRLSAPLVAAWLWERGLALQRRASGAKKKINWRLTAERVLVWLRLAEPAERAASDVDAHRRIARLARAAKRLGDRRAAKAPAWRQLWAKRRLDTAMGAAVAHAGLASDPARQDALRDQLGALLGAEALASLNPAAPWERRMQEDQAAAEVAEIKLEAEALADAARADRDRAVGEAATAAEAAEARAEAAAADAARARAEARELHGTVTASIRALDETRAQAIVAARAGEERAAAEVTEARRRAEALVQAAMADRDRAAAEAGQLRGTVTAAARALEDARTDLRDRTERAERELADARMRADELAEVLARAERPQARTRTRAAAGQSARDRTARSRSGGGDADGVDRDALVTELAAEILTTAGAGGQWQPDYDALTERTGYSRRWCEYVVRHARDAVARTQAEPRNEKPATTAHAESRADAGEGGGHDGAAEPRGQPMALTAVDDRAAS